MSLAIAIVGFIQSIAIAKTFAYKHHYELDSSQELISLGITNLFASMFQSFPVSACLGQSAANDESGAQTGLASITTGVVVLLVLLFITPVFELLPLNILAAIVISYVFKMLVSS